MAGMNDSMPKKVLVILSMNDEANRKKLAGIFDYTRDNVHWEITITEPQSVKSPKAFSRLHGILLGELVDANIPKSIPVVAMFRPAHDRKSWKNRNMSHIYLDNTDVGRIAAEQFVNAGFTSFAYINTPSLPIWSEERAAAFRAALPEGSPCRVWPENGFSNLPEWLADLPKRTAILASEDTVARDAMLMCNAQGIEIPRDLAFISVDNDELLCTTCRTPLTSIEPDFRRSGFITAKILDEMMSARHPLCITERYGVNRIIIRSSSIYPDRQNDSRLEKAISMIRTRSHEHIRVGDVAKAVNMSRRSAELMFRQRLNRSIGEVIRATRLDAMMQRLKESRASISDICIESGFASESYAKRAFKARFGKTMSDFRRMDPKTKR